MSSLGESLLASARANAERPALWVKNKRFTYGELFEKAGAIAAALQTAGLAAGDRVAILSYRTEIAYAAILGTLLAGCAYVPLNTRFPAERNSGICRASQASAIVLDDACAGELDRFFGPLDNALVVLTPQSASVPLNHTGLRIAGPDLPRVSLDALRARPPKSLAEPAYVLFTSGTTGAPKGVPISHANLAHYAEAIRDIAPIGPDDRLLQLADLTFDLSVHDMFVAWLNGAELYSAPEQTTVFSLRMIRQFAITACLVVPSIGAQALDHGLLKPGSLPSLRISLFLGEALPAEVAAAWSKAAVNAQVFNTYGPTEATILVSGYRVDQGPAHGLAVVPIGHPLAGLRIGAFGADGSEVAAGETGELYLAGPQLTEGYWLAPHIDAEKFTTVGGTRWYRTGDVGRLDDTHGYIFAGRADRQVKINGFRVELQEIEGALRRACGREQVAVIAWPPVSPGNATGTMAFVAGKEIATEQVLAAVARIVPDYAVPADLLLVERLPLNSNGKVDYRALGDDPRLTAPSLSRELAG